MTKRIFDSIFSLLGLIIFMPVLVVLGVMVMVDSSGPAFYLSKRVGRGGKEFLLFKFRTMVKDADKVKIFSTASDDPRLTRVGKFLKKFQLDELPQLINVLRGDMSLVGPRPEIPFYVNMMSEEEKRTILSVRPGITDWASLWNFHEGEALEGSADPDKTYQEVIRPEKLRLQIKYVRERSFQTDLKIIFETIKKIVSP